MGAFSMDSSILYFELLAEGMVIIFIKCPSDNKTECFITQWKNIWTDDIYCIYEWLIVWEEFYFWQTKEI